MIQCSSQVTVLCAVVGQMDLRPVLDVIRLQQPHQREFANQRLQRVLEPSVGDAGPRLDGAQRLFALREVLFAPRL